MERIDRLIIKAQKVAQRTAERFTIGFVTYLPDANLWEAQGNLTCGKPGRGGRSSPNTGTKKALFQRWKVFRKNTLML